MEQILAPRIAATGYAKIAEDEGDAAAIVEKILTDDSFREGMMESLEKVGKPLAAYFVADMLVAAASG